jgi:phosphoglycerate dehydrogenase-like enzyme
VKEHCIARAPLDTFPRHPLPTDSELWNLPNVIVSPRIGGLTEEKWPPLLPIFVDNLKRFVAGEPLRNVVDKDLGY